MKECVDGKIRNPSTGRCVNKDGVIGRSIRSRSTSRKSTSRKSTSRKSRSRKSTSRKTECSTGKIRNPSTGRCVSEDGKIGKLIRRSRSGSRKSPSRKSPSRKSPSRKSRQKDKSERDHVSPFRFPTNAEIDSMTVAQLKQTAKRLGVPTTGYSYNIVPRIKTAIEENGSKTEIRKALSKISKQDLSLISGEGGEVLNSKVKHDLINDIIRYNNVHIVDNDDVYIEGEDIEDKIFNRKIHLRNGKFHNENGLAIDSYFRQEYWIDGKLLTSDEWQETHQGLAGLTKAAR
jgi:hypothetical protein